MWHLSVPALLAAGLSLTPLVSAAPKQCPSTDKPLNPYPKHPVLTFKRSQNNTHVFNIGIFSDLHFGWNLNNPDAESLDDASVGIMHEVLDAGLGIDYVVINGDLVTGANVISEKNGTELLDKLFQPLIDSKLPFSVTHGNHDNSRYISHRAEIAHEQKLAPAQSYTRIADEKIGGPGGPGNYWVPVYKSKNDATPALVMWFFDSRGQKPAPGSDADSGIKDWVDKSVAKWIKRETKKMDKKWGRAEKTGRQAVAFTHIPPHHIKAVSENLDPVKNPGQNGMETTTQDGEKMTRDQPFWDSLNANVKNLRAVISGHIHGNEWCAREPTKDVIFCFNKHTGHGGNYQEGWTYGIRQIEFTLQGESQDVVSWLYLEGGEERHRVKLDDAFGR